MKIDNNFLGLLLSACTFSVSVTFATRRSFGEECDRIQKCNKTLWLSCRDGKCDCAKPDEMVYDEKQTKCLTKSGERCKYGTDSEEPALVEITDCIPNAICSIEGVCQCDSKYHEMYNGTCELSVLYGEKCSEEDQCSKFVGLHCVDSKCECKDGIYSEEKGLCVGRSQSNCLRNECVYGAICVQGTCLCDSEHFHSIEKTCLPKKKIFEDCDRDVQCMQTNYLNLQCISGKCSCSDKLVYSFVQRYEYTTSFNYGYEELVAIGFSGPPAHVCAPRIGKKCLDGYCSESAFCKAYGKYTEPISGSCECKDGRSSNKGFEYCAMSYNNYCTYDKDCIDDLVCSNGKCNCPSPLHQFFDVSAKTCVSKVGGHCTEISTCVPHSSCVYSTSTGRNGHCRCDSSAVVNKDRYCDLSYGEDCVEGGVLCDTFAGLLCINRKCSCPDTMYEYNAKFRKCLGLVGAACNKLEENIVCERSVDENNGEQPSDCHATSQSKLVCIENAYCKDESPLMECNCADGYVETDNHTCVSIKAMKSLCSGETNCSNTNKEKKSTKSHEISYDKEACKLLHTCKNGQCIPKEWICDGIIQCDDNSDEINCPGTEYKNISLAAKEQCDSSSQWPCYDGQCINLSQLCDGIEDCDDGSDEGEGC